MKIILIIVLKIFIIFWSFQVFVYSSQSLNNTDNKCDPVFPCTSDDSCNGGKCIGRHTGKCLCLCTPNRRCNNDVACGLFSGACNNGRCDCLKAFQKAGYR
ncbi:hypothetical protein Mgra_00006440, partial [Meloidogyne graminicola]